MGTIKILTYLFWFLFIAASYIGYKYKNSRNKHIFFKTGPYRALIAVFTILIVSPILINILLPDNFLLYKKELLTLDRPNLLSLLKGGNLWQYYSDIIRSILHNINLIGLISATLILFTWFVYLCRIDFFDKEQMKYPLVTLLLGMCFCFLTLLISDLASIFYPTKLSGNLFNDLFIYCFLKIGVIEEFVKLIPFFIILNFTKQINEPYDYILYASISALGFAFIENLIYFREISETVIQGRALLSVLGHILFSSLSVYGLILAKYRYKGPSVKLFLSFFFIGSFLHGFYDYLCFNSWSLLLIAMFVFILQAWTVMVNNSINNSSFFSFNIYFREEKLRFFLAIMLASIVILNYISNTLYFGKEAANQKYLSTTLFAGLFVVYYITSLSNFDLIKGYWRPVYFRTAPVNNNQLPGNRGPGKILSLFKYNFIIPLNFINYRITLHPPHYNHKLYDFMDKMNGKIVDRICLNRDLTNKKNQIDTEWFLVDLESNIILEGNNINRLLIKLENNSDCLIHDTDVRAYLRLVPDILSIKKELPSVADFPFVGYVLVNVVEIPELLKKT